MLTYPVWIAADPKAMTLHDPRFATSTWRASKPGNTTSWLSRLHARPFLERPGLTFAGHVQSAATPTPAAWNALRLRREIGRYKATFSLIFRLKWLAASLSLQHATFFVLEHPEDFGAMPKGPPQGTATGYYVAMATMCRASAKRATNSCLARITVRLWATMCPHASC